MFHAGSLFGVKEEAVIAQQAQERPPLYLK
jgi:hypothetical protein